MIKRFNEYYSTYDFSDKNFLNSIEKFKITKKDYHFVFFDNEEADTPKYWLPLNDKEKSIIIDYTYRSYSYILYDSDDLYIDLIKMPDDYYYYINVISRNDTNYSNNMYYYKLDQLSELKFFIKQLNIFKKHYD